MTYAAHLAASRDLNIAQLDSLLAGLARDERFCAVVGWLDRNREAFVQAGSRQELASEAGRMAHAQGSVHALHVLSAQLANLLTPPPPSGIEQPAEE